VSGRAELSSLKVPVLSMYLPVKSEDNYESLKSEQPLLRSTLEAPSFG
jgi:hypothetical protein